MEQLTYIHIVEIIFQKLLTLLFHGGSHHYYSWLDYSGAITIVQVRWLDYSGATTINCD